MLNKKIGVLGVDDFDVDVNEWCSEMMDKYYNEYVEKYYNEYMEKYYNEYVVEGEEED